MPAMNGFNRSYMYRSTETEKKGRKLRNHREYACRCFPSFVRFHCHDCPAVMKPCPIHGDIFYPTEKQQKKDREKNVIISFHPSTKTERLLQPIKTLLAHCNSETKVNFQYYSPENTNGKESVKPQNGQNAYESFKKSLNNNIFVEKTKSFVANRTNKVKKLKQCFHSPCNSIAQKTRSQTSITEKLNQILREEAKQTRDVFYNLVPEIPPDDKKWLSSKHHDFLSDEKSDSDFITVTQQDKTNTIHHKIFEIKHRKGLNDIPFVGFPQQQTHLVYSTVNTTGGGAVKENIENPCECEDQKCLSFHKTVPECQEGAGERGKISDPCPSEKTNGSIASSSTDSVYITPFIFVPKGMEDSDCDIKSKVKQFNVVEIGVQVEELQTPRQVTSQKETLISLTSKKSSQVSKHSGGFRDHEETKCHSVLLQTDSLLFEGRICHSSRRLCEPRSTSRTEQIYVGSHERAVMTRNYDDESSRQSKRSEMSRRTIDSTQQTKATEMQTCSCKNSVRTPDSARYRKTTEMQTCNCSIREKTPDSGRGTKTTEIQTCSGTISVRTPDSARYRKTTEMQTCNCSIREKTPDSGRCTKTTEIQTFSGTISVRTPDSARYRKTTEMQTCNCSIRERTPDSGRGTKTAEIQTCSGTISVRTPDSARYRKTTEMQTCSCTPYTRTPDSGRHTTTEIQPGSLTPRTEVLIQARWDTRDKTSQTDDLWNLQVSVKTFDSGMNKSEGSEAYTTTHLRLSNKEIQTSFYQSCPAECEFIELNSPEVTYVIKPFEQQESDQAVDKLAKTWWGKSHSDSDLCERLKCACCKLDNENLYLQSDFSKNFGTNNTPEKSTTTKVYESDVVAARMENCPTLGSVTVRTKETVERCCPSKQTCTREEELSAAVSDLSELKKIIQEFFEKGNLSSKKACECEKTVTKEAMVDAETMTDISILPPKQEQKKTFVDMAVQTNLQGGKKDTANQTSVTVLLEEGEQQKADNQSTEQNSKTFFVVCAVCGRDMKHSADATTNNSPFSEWPKMSAVGAEYSESFEVKMISKKLQNCDNSKVSKANSPMTSERADDKAARKTTKQQEDPCRPESSLKTKIPVPSHSAFVHFKNNETTVQRATDFPAPVLSHHRSTAPRGSHKAFTDSERECICNEVAVPSTSKEGTSQNESTRSKATKSGVTTKEYPEVENNRRSSHAERRKSKRNNQEYYPVLVTHFWPKEIFKTWKSMEGALNDIPSSDDAKSQNAKQKRSYSKDLETAAADAGKKMTADASHLSQEFLPELSHLFGQICPSNFMSYRLKTQEDEKNSTGTDREAVKKLAQSLRETFLETDEDILQDSLHCSNSSNTENSFSGDEEDDEDTVRETTATEHSARHNFNAASTQASKLKPQSHSAVSFNASPSPEDATTSKSLNTFLIIINPKKHKMFRRKHTK